MNRSQVAGKFSLFQCLPAELQLTTFEAALDNLAKPRIVNLDIETVPAYDAARSRDLTLGWQLRVNNNAALHEENPLAMARSLSHTCRTGRYVAKRFMKEYRVWDGPQHCHALFSKDISLSSDVFWLPENLLAFDQIKANYFAAQEDWKDEERISCLMVSLDALEQVARWATGRFDDWDFQAVEDGQVSLGDLGTTLDSVLACYPSCEEIIVMVGAPSGDREHISWDDLNYIGAENEQASGCDSYAVDRDEAGRCQNLAQTYCEMYDNDDQSAPALSFAFRKGRRSRVPAPVPKVTVPAGSGSRKRSREDDEVDITEMPAKKRQRTC